MFKKRGRIKLAFREYLHEKAEESRHNETLGYLIAIMGSVFLVGGILETVMTAPNPKWFLFFPYEISTHPYSLLGLSLTVIGIVLLLLGIVISIHYALERSWYMSKLKEAHTIEQEKLRYNSSQQKEV